MYRLYTNTCSQIFTQEYVFIGYNGALSFNWLRPRHSRCDYVANEYALSHLCRHDLDRTNVFPTDTRHVPTHLLSHTIQMVYLLMIMCDL